VVVLLQARKSTSEDAPSKYDPSPLENQESPTRREIRESIQRLIIAVSLFFVITWIGSAGRLLSSPTYPPSPVVVDAEEVLRQDWERLNDVE